MLKHRTGKPDLAAAGIRPGRGPTGHTSGIPELGRRLSAGQGRSLYEAAAGRDTRPGDSDANRRVAGRGMSPRPARRGRSVTGPALLAGALGLGGLALLNHRAGRRATARLPRHHFVRVDGVRLHYIEQGTGTPVVLLHGNGAMAQDFAASGLLQRLAARHRVIAFDRPGFGYSERPRGRVWDFSAQADLLRQALRQLGLQRSVIVGHSAGSLAALAMGLRDPSGTAALVLLSGFYFPRARTDMLITALFALPPLRQAAAASVAYLFGWLVLPAFLRAVFAPYPVSERFVRSFPFSATLRPSQLQATIADTPMLLLNATLMPRRFGVLSMPVSIVAGTRDRIVNTARQSERLHRSIPGSRLVEIPGAGHMVHYVDPDRVAAVVEAAARAAYDDDVRCGNDDPHRESSHGVPDRLRRGEPYIAQ